MIFFDAHTGAEGWRLQFVVAITSALSDDDHVFDNVGDHPRMRVTWVTVFTVCNVYHNGWSVRH